MQNTHQIQIMRLANAQKQATPAPASYDPDFQSWIDYNILQGHYMTNDTVKLDAANQYVVNSKADGTWQGKDVDFIFAWNDLNMADASLVCLKRLIKVDVYGGCTYTVNGWEGNGINGYIDVNYDALNTGVNYTLNNAGQGFTLYKEATNSGLIPIVGIQFASGVNTFWNRSTTAQRIICNVNNLDSNVDFSGTGLKSGYRDNNTDVRMYSKGVENIRTQQGDSTNFPTRFTLMYSSGNYSNLGLTSVYFSYSFTQSQNESIRTNLNTYLSTIGLTPIA